MSETRLEMGFPGGSVVVVNSEGVDSVQGAEVMEVG